MKKCEGFDKVYPFTTENISGYMTYLNVKDKHIFTVGSSSDQAFNSILLGAKEVTIFDINQNTKKFFEEKKKIILESALSSIYDKILNINDIEFSSDIFSKKDLSKMNLYMKDETSFSLLKEKLKQIKVNILNGDIFHIENEILHDKFDVMILSNVLQYVSVSKDEKIEEVIYDIFSSLSKYLNTNGLIQLFYLYASIYPEYFIKLLQIFEEKNLNVEKIKCDNSKDSIILVKNH